MCNLINYCGGAEKSFPSSTSFRQKLELWFGFGPKYVPKKEITKTRSKESLDKLDKYIFENIILYIYLEYDYS